MFTTALLYTVFVLVLLPESILGFCFQNYPQCSQEVLYAKAPSSCNFGCLDNTTSTQTNKCLCSDVSFQRALAGHLYTSCGCSELLDSAQTWVDNCNATNTPSVMDESALVAAGKGNDQQCTSATGATPANPTASSSSNNDSLSDGAKVGISIAGAALIAFLSWLGSVWWDIRKKRKEEKKNRTLPRPTSELIKENIQTTTQSLGKWVSIINCCSLNGKGGYHQSNIHTNGTYDPHPRTHNEMSDGYRAYNVLQYPAPVHNPDRTITMREV